MLFQLSSKYLSTLMVAGALTSASPALAEFPDEPIRLIVPYSPGGGFDTFARAFAPELEKALGTEVTIDNVPGAGGRRAIQTMLNEDPDGHTITMFNVPGIVVSQVTGNMPEVDLKKIEWVASVSKSTYSLVLSANGDISKMDDLCSLGRPAKFSATGPGSSSHTAAIILMKTFDCPLTLVTGYEGSTESILAVMRGEVDAMVTGVDSANKFVASGDARFGATFSVDTVVQDVQSTGELGFPELASLAQIRMIGAAPGTPEEIIELLSAAFEQAAASKELAEWSVAVNRPISYLDHDESSAIIDVQFGVMAEFADAFE